VRVSTTESTDLAQTARLIQAARRQDATAQDHLACARSLLEHKLPERALEHLLQASHLLPSPELAALAGSVAVSVGQLDCAVEQFRAHHERDPDAPEPFANLALIHAAREDWSAAALDMRQALRRHDGEPEWHNDLGVILFKLEDFEGARAALERALELRPDYIDAAMNLADLHQSREETEAAFRVLAEIARYHPGDAALRERKLQLWNQLPADFHRTWQDPPLHPSVYDSEYFENHLGTSETTATWREHRGRRLDERFNPVVQLALAGADDEVLDLGCGRGELARYFAGLCRSVVAVDYSESAVAITREVCADLPNVEVICADAKSIDFESRFALVVMTDVAEHLYPWEWKEVLTRVLRALKPGGQLIIHSPIVGEIRLGKGAASHAHVVPREMYDFPVHVNLMTWPELEASVRERGFQPGQVRFDGKIVFEARKPGVETAPLPTPARRGALSGRRLALFASNTAFLGDIRRMLEVDNEVRLFTGGSRALMQRELEWCELAWFEWCDEFLQAATTLPKTCKIVCRLHSFEAFTHHPEHVDWSKVDGLVFVNESVRRLMVDRIPSDLATIVIPNGVDFERFRFPDTKRYGKKVAYAGYLNFKKNPGFLLACFEALWRDDPELTFHIAGSYQGAHLQVFFEHLLPKLPFPVQLCGWVDDMPAWLADKDFIVSSSYFESFHYAVAEGIASGLLPLVYNWPGSENCYPADVRFNTLAECVEVMHRHRAEPEPLGRARRLRDHLASRFEVGRQLADTRGFLERVFERESTRPAPRTTAAAGFAAKPYWEQRLSAHFDLAGVGYLDLGETYNRYMYKLRSERLRERLAELGIQPAGRRILDVGSGTGFFVDFWLRYGPARMEALDLTDTAVTRLRERFPELSVHQADLASKTWNLAGGYDIVSAFDVLFHIVDDAGFSQALTNLAASLTPGGHLILTACYTAAPYAQQSEHYRARTETEYRQAFDRSGLTLVAAEPMFVTMNAPLDLSRVHDAGLRELYEELWDVTGSLFKGDLLPGAAQERAARWAYLHERLHLASGVASPSSKLLVLQKTGAGTPGRVPERRERTAP
jgi:cyclopropane fatty-acyl-phospholipid synthase-like methyltransferase/Flp pilus assembly protein TadD